MKTYKKSTVSFITYIGNKMCNYGKDKIERLYLAQLKTILLQHSLIIKILIELQRFSLTLYLSAGVIRNLIWAHLHDEDYSLKNTEIDIIFYDEKDDGTQNLKIERVLVEVFPDIDWDIVNQALVHGWYVTDQGKKIPPLSSIEHALSLWPETATAVAIRLNLDNEFECISPFGLSDLFELKLRWNKALVSEETFIARLKQKKFLEKWPKLKIIS